MTMTSPHHDELFLAIGRLEGKVDSLIVMQQNQSEQIKDHDHRLRSLEHSRGYMLGWAAAIGAMFSFAANYLIKHLS
jgi:hypothetical protein